MIDGAPELLTPTGRARVAPKPVSAEIPLRRAVSATGVRLVIRSPRTSPRLKPSRDEGELLSGREWQWKRVFHDLFSQIMRTARRFVPVMLTQALDYRKVETHPLLRSSHIPKA